MTDQAVVKKQRRVSSIWFIPAIAFLIGGWMLAKAIFQADPQVTISFDTANGIEPGRTTVKSRSVEIGLVEKVELNSNFDGAPPSAQKIFGVSSHIPTC